MAETMLIRTVRKPGEPGTQRLVRQHGDRLACVRYRYTPSLGKRHKTIELIVAEENWLAPSPQTKPAVAKHQAPTTPIVPVHIHYSERDLQRQIKAIGGKWDAGKKLWFAPEAYIKKIGLSKRIVK